MGDEMRIALRVLMPPFLQGPGSSGRTAATFRRNDAAAADEPSTASNGQGGDERVWRVDVPGVAEAVPLLRRWMRLLLAEDAKLAEAFELIVSEYGTNALWHSASGAPGGRIKAELCLGLRRARLTVLDSGALVRGDRAPGDPAEHGRGLLLASAYADEVGHHDTPGGHAVWALINR
jgi:anti-sigma regulatory factor (Ser/Thr protein kinase)